MLFITADSSLCCSCNQKSVLHASDTLSSAPCRSQMCSFLAYCVALTLARSLCLSQRFVMWQMEGAVARMSDYTDTWMSVHVESV